ncbi:conserved protein of unknown function [Pseudomonas marincola]|uniref:Uncharacterized protein n=1 Tax=Pseudomonas marincola TaxID=437900 RepID=A0A653DYN5_9PSED|nr:conserved protein of unknown function [Pseudomonas marincola]
MVIRPHASSVSRPNVHSRASTGRLSKNSGLPLSQPPMPCQTVVQNVVLLKTSNHTETNKICMGRLKLIFQAKEDELAVLSVVGLVTSSPAAEPRMKPAYGARC